MRTWRVRGAISASSTSHHTVTTSSNTRLGEAIHGGKITHQSETQTCVLTAIVVRREIACASRVAAGCVSARAELSTAATNRATESDMPSGWENLG